MKTRDKRQKFEQLMLPHLDAAYNLARWLTRDEHLARDAVQDAYLRAFRFFETFHGENSRAWLMAIVRNVCFTLYEKRSSTVSFDESRDDGEGAEGDFDQGCWPDPADMALRSAEREALNRAIENLAPEYREVIVLRELEGFSYKEVATIAAIPIGTVMSRLSRARALLQRALRQHFGKELGQ